MLVIIFGLDRIHFLVKFLHCGMHFTNGSPVYDTGQLHIGLWFITTHSADIPQAPMHGSIHFWLLQALLRAQSELTMHSDLQEGGVPLKPVMHVHTATPFIVLQWLFGPHGDGLQGFCNVSKYHVIIN